MFGRSLKKRNDALIAENATLTGEKAELAAALRDRDVTIALVKDENAALVRQLADERNRSRVAGRALSEKVEECSRLASELAPLKAQRERANANLRAANEARRRKPAANGAATGVGAA